MKAVVYTKYGSPEVLQLVEVDKPAPKDGEVLVRVFATTVVAEDPRFRSGKYPFMFWLYARLTYGLMKPKKTILGMYLAGEIESVGKDVTAFKAGDQVFGFSHHTSGTYAEYACLPANGVLAAKPANMTYEEAVAVPNGALTALFFLRKGNIQGGREVLIYGASGAVGTAAVQLARYFGAEVTAVCSTKNLELVESLGAHRVVDYAREDFTRGAMTYDIIFDTVGKTGAFRSKRSLKPGGVYLLTTGGLSHFALALSTSIVGHKKVLFAASSFSWTSEDLEFIKGLCETEDFKAVIDRRYPLEEISEAHRYVEQGHKRGNVVVTVA